MVKKIGGGRRGRVGVGEGRRVKGVESRGLWSRVAGDEPPWHWHGGGNKYTHLEAGGRKKKEKGRLTCAWVMRGVAFWQTEEWLSDWQTPGSQDSRIPSPARRFLPPTTPRPDLRFLQTFSSAFPRHFLAHCKWRCHLSWRDAYQFCTRPCAKFSLFIFFPLDSSLFHTCCTHRLQVQMCNKKKESSWMLMWGINISFYLEEKMGSILLIPHM